ncbi:hypothetical protein [Curtobacterium sp. MCSS17_007]|uniref:hypothetical protein n=1 Tax=Curtobacterium sp. MCSS17_007 TaxID=2175646 RepID=UPI0011B847EE|nr:hypothetical protein [Curtobacterium sp. MCSS17_007]WIE76229.1 hypothetical protein DEJ22_002900 [Curtobacterium sp. MCSS17_007]
MATRSVRTAAVGVIVGALALTVGCTGGTGSPSTRPEDAKRAVQQLVDDPASALGGNWTVEEGPRLGTCTDERGNGDGSYSGRNGRGSGIATISFTSSDLGGGDTIRATSECAAGDYVELREQERGQR